MEIDHEKRLQAVKYARASIELEGFIGPPLSGSVLPLCNLIARKRSAHAEGGGVKERSSRTPAHLLARIRTAHSDWKAAGSQPKIAVTDTPS